jgi:hypothetical protein
MNPVLFSLSMVSVLIAKMQDVIYERAMKPHWENVTKLGQTPSWGSHTPLE